MQKLTARILSAVLLAATLQAEVRIEGSPGDWKLLRDGKPHVAKGVGGDGSWELLAKLGGNSVRTWGHEKLGEQLDRAQKPGLYRVTAIVRDGKGGAATANFPVRVDAPVVVAKGGTTKLPLTVYADADSPQTYIPSGWMGNAKAMKVDPASTEQPKSGANCMRVEFAATTGCGAVAWRHPAQDWGDQRGGFDLTGAKRLVFDARGDEGGEEVSFGFGTIGKEKRFHDTAKRSLGKVKLSREWQQFEVKLDDIRSPEDLTRIKTGFLFSLAADGAPVVFYLDNIRWE